MTEEERDELQRRANQLDISTAALMRLLIKQLKNIKTMSFISEEFASANNNAGSYFKPAKTRQARCES